MAKKPKTRKLPNMQIRSAFVPSTVNEEDRTVEVTFGTETPTRMYNWDIGSYIETMSFEDGHVRWDRLNGGAPVLDNHNSYGGTKGVLGIVEKAWSEDGQGKALLRFDSESDGAEAFRKVKEGLLSGVSFGYRVYKYEKTEGEEGELPKMRAIDWEGFEISLAPIQADAESKVRNNSEEFGEVEIIDLSLQSNRAINGENEKTNSEPMDEAEKKRLADLEAANKRTLEAAEKAERAKKIEDAAKAERSRISLITDLCRKFEVKDDTLRGFIDNGTSIDNARAEIMDSWEANDPNEGQRSGADVSVKAGADETDKYRAAAEESIHMRTTPNTKDEHGGSDFRGMKLVDLAKDTIVRNGGSVRGMSDREVFKEAINGQRSGSMSTSDFPLILGNAINRSLNKSYSETERTFTDWASQGVAKDFRAMNPMAISGVVESFKEVKEGAEYEHATMTEGTETYQVAKYGQIIPLTWEAMINDDLGAFKRVPQAIANKAAQKQSDIVYAILTGNPTMGDGTALFDAAHGNLGTDGDISDTTLREMKKLFRNQTSLSGDFINVSPKYLICGAEMEHLALKFMNSNFSPTTVGDQNIYQGLMKVIVDGRISNEDWFAAASPSQIDTVEYSFLEGEGELFTEQKQGFEVDGLQIKARMVFGAKALDHRGLFKNPNA